MTISIQITRLAFHRRCVLGELRCGDLLLKTLEPEWNLNAHAMSCIPFGVYPAARCQSEHLGDVILLHETAPREGILIHGGNFRRETQGCILVGASHDMHEGEFCVIHSAEAMHRLRMLPKSDNYLIELRGPVLPDYKSTTPSS